MSEYLDLKRDRPIRYVVAVTAYRALWWPFVAVCLPFFLVGSLIDWLSWTAFPTVSRFYQPVGRAAHGGALRVGNEILGYKPDQPQ